MAALSVSIVIVNYRSAPLAIDCLRSVEQERRTAGIMIRAVLVDNASGDHPALSTAIGENGWHSWVTLVLAPRNGGFASGNNLGILLALERDFPDYVLLLNPDTQVRPGAIASLVEFLQAHPEVGIAGSSFENLDGTDWPIAFRFPTIVSEFCEALGIGFVMRLFGRWMVAREMTPTAQPVDWICGASMMIRPRVFSEIGGFDENYFLYYEETDFCFRARRSGFPTWYVPASRVMHIMGQSTKVTEPWAKRKPLPDYWFESRRRYFAVTSGVRQAMAVDLIVLMIYPLGFLKRILSGQHHTTVPRYWRCVWRHSVLRPRNRPVQAFCASASLGSPPA